MYEPAAVEPDRRHPCCGIRPAGELTGAVIGGCQIIGEIGSGSTGVVYLAEQLRLKRRVALKLLYDVGDPGARDLFFAEARIAGRLAHPNAVRVYGADENERHFPYMVMEYAAGPTIEELLESGRRFTEKETRRIALEIARTLADIWQQEQLTHGDLKPANVILRKPDHSVCILDLGLQTALRDAGIRTAMGTPIYAAPELLNEAFGNCDFRTDVYSLGIMMYEMLSGSAPFTGTPDEILVHHQAKDAPPLRSRVPGVSPQFARLVDRMICRYAPERPDWPEVIRKLSFAEHDSSGRIPARRLLFAVCIGLLCGILGCCLAAYSAAKKKTADLRTCRSKLEIRHVFRLAEAGKTAEVRKCLQSGFPADSEDDSGNTLLMHAVLMNQPETVREILRYSPDPVHRNKLGETARDLAGKNTEMIRLLEKEVKK